MTLDGQVVSEVKSRTTPAGINISRFTLEHHSQQREAGKSRKVDCRIIVIAAGESFEQITQSLTRDMRVSVEGFISYESSQQLETRLVLHAQNITELKHQD